MAATALIQLTQGGNVGTAGQALFGTTGTSVSIANNSNTGVASWQIDLVYVPPGSGVSTGTLASSDNGATPSASFTPDVRGPYRIILYVWDAINRVGTATDTDIRNFGVKQANGVYRPAPQIWPQPLPPTASGRAGNKPDENNFAGQGNGWSGSGSDGLLDDTLQRIDKAVQVAAGTQTGSTGTINFVNSNGLTFGMSGSSQITGSYTVPTQTVQTVGLYGLGNTTQNSSTTLDARSLSFNGLGIVTVGYSNGSIQVSASTAAQSNQTEGRYAIGNTTGQSSSSTFDARTMSISGAGNISVGYSGNALLLSVSTAAQTAQTQNIVVPAGSNTTYTSGTVVFSGSNAVTVRSTTGQAIIIDAPVQTVQTQSNVQGLIAGTQSGRTGDISFANSNGLTFGMSGSNTITGSYTVPTQSNQTIGLYALGNTTQNSSTTLDARTLSFNALGAATMGYSNGSIQVSVPVQTVQTQSNIQAIYDGANSITTGTIRFTNANGVTFSINGQVISGSVAAQSNQTIGLYAVSNTTQNSSTTLDARTLSFQGAGIASVGYSNGSIVVSVPSGAPSPVNFSAGTTSSNLGSVIFSNSPTVSFGLNGATITASAAGGGGGGTLNIFALGNTTQNSSSAIGTGSVSFNALGAMTMGFTNGSIQVSAPPSSSIVGVGGVSISTNGSTISISGPTITNFERLPLFATASTTYAPAIGSWYFEPFYLPANVTGGHLRRIFSFGTNGSQVLQQTSATQFGSGTTGSRSVNFSYANSIALYALGSGSNSTRLESVWSNTFSVGLRQSVSVATGGATTISATNAATISYVASINSAGVYTTASFSQSGSSSSGTSSLATGNLSSAVSSIFNLISGQLIIPIGINSTITPGNYFLAQAWSSASTTTGTTAQVWSFINQLALAAGASTSLSTRMWGQTASNTTQQHYPGQGALSFTTASPPSTIAFGDIRPIASNFEQYFNIVNTTI